MEIEAKENLAMSFNDWCKLMEKKTLRYILVPRKKNNALNVCHTSFPIYQLVISSFAKFNAAKTQMSAVYQVYDR